MSVLLRPGSCLLVPLILAVGPSAAPAQAPPPPPPVEEGAPAPTPAERTLPYTLEILPTGDEALDAALAGASQLARLREPAPTDAFGVIGRARGDLDRLDTALRSEGYYGGRLQIEIAGQPLDAPGLAERLAAAPTLDPVPIRVLVEPGPRYRIARVAVRAPTPEGGAAAAAAAAEPFGLAPGDPARAAAVLDAEAALLDRLRRAGHPLAAAMGREAVVDHDQRTMEVSFNLAPGPRARFAAPRVVGQERTDTAFLERIAGRIAGETYSPERIERIERDLRGLGVFASVRARPADRLEEGDTLPVTITVEERPLRAIGVSIAYETDYGPSGRIYWEHRNLFGGAERLRLEAEVSRLGAGDDGVQDTGFRVGGSLRSPFLGGRDLTMTTELFAIRERLRAYDRDVLAGSVLFERQLTDRLAVQAGPTVEIGEVGRDDDMRPVHLVGVTLGARWDSTDGLLDPTRGLRAGGSLTPYYEFREGATFARLRLTASTYWDVAGNGRSVVALRGTLGSVLGATGRDEIPLDKRFYAGGGGSVRGYDYQAIGPKDALGRPLGGTSLLEGSVELRQRLWGELGGVLFLDAGTIGPRAVPTFDEVRFGVGVGLRYRTVIGPLRADIAVPLNRERGESSGYGLYLGLGQAF